MVIKRMKTAGINSWNEAAELAMEKLETEGRFVVLAAMCHKALSNLSQSIYDEQQIKYLRNKYMEHLRKNNLNTLIFIQI